MPLFDELLLRVARREELSPIELEDFRTQAKRLNEVKDRVESWMTPADNDPKFRVVRGQTLHVDHPLNHLVFNMQADLSVSDVTNTYITFDQKYGYSLEFTIDLVNDPQKIYVKYPGRDFYFSGLAQWAANATGYRAVFLEGFTTGGVSLGSVPLYTAPGHSLTDNWSPFFFLINSENISALEYFKLFAFQSSGGSLTLKSLLCGVHVI